MIKKINFYHSLIFFNFCIIISAFSFLRNNNLVMLCLFLILTIGISHGALDNIKGKKLLKFLRIKSMSTFYIGYSLISLSIEYRYTNGIDLIFWFWFSPSTKNTGQIKSLQDIDASETILRIKGFILKRLIREKGNFLIL